MGQLKKEETITVRGEERELSELDIKEYTDKVDKLYEQGLLTKRGVIEDWKEENK